MFLSNRNRISFLPHWSAPNALVSLGIAATVLPTFLLPSPVVAASFSDVTFNYWARPFIERLADKGIIKGFPDGTFQPDKPVTRAEFAAIVRQAFTKSQVRSRRDFRDVPGNYWAAPAIEQAYTTGFMSGYPDGEFRPTQQIPKVQVLVSLAAGLGLNSRGTAANILNVYKDAAQIPDYATNGVAAATQKGIVVNYPDRQFLDPQQTATRGDVSAFIYQALVSQGQLSSLPSQEAVNQYIVGNAIPAGGTDNQPNNPGNANNPRFWLARGTTINTTYLDQSNNSVRLILAPGETVNATLVVSEPVRNDSGQVVIPQGSRLMGQFKSVNGNGIVGARYISDRVVIGNRTFSIRAVSKVRPASRAFTQQDVGGGIATASASQALSTLFGDRMVNILAGILGEPINPRGQTVDQLIIFNPQDLQLTIATDWVRADNLQP
jgi:S-layer homology domain